MTRPHAPLRLVPPGRQDIANSLPAMKILHGFYRMAAAVVSGLEHGNGSYSAG